MTEQKANGRPAPGRCDPAKWQRLVEIMARLRAPDGCPWDKAQDHQSLKRYFLEEAYEVLDAIDRGSDASLCDELGDSLLQVVFHAQLAAERGSFTIDDVVDAICNKMERRHPHIFGTAHADDPDQVLSMWEAIKARERKESQGEKRGLMDVNDNLPALMMAQKIQDKAHRVGFDWADREGSWRKLAEETAELRAAAGAEEALDELGDLIFAAVNLARFYDIDAEQALRHTNRKFMSRFKYIEDSLDRQGKDWADCDESLLEALWQQAKEKERDHASG
ncbi:MAG: nucleoside triphosphate pyrophosphohydrolase [Firmicutes bacterium]|nr:nucleoside triphosphate pyrophosphohydrolase [Bacillota bacterium]